MAETTLAKEGTHHQTLSTPVISREETEHRKSDNHNSEFHESLHREEQQSFPCRDKGCNAKQGQEGSFGTE